MNKKSHKPPSRIRYEQNHPIISFIIEKRLHDKLNSYLEKNKISKPDFIKIALKEQEENYDIAFNNGHNIGNQKGEKTGYIKGYNKAHDDWAIWLYCSRCRQPYYIIPNSEEHKKINNYMLGQIGHDNCKPTFWGRNVYL